MPSAGSHVQTDVLIIGCGISGAVAALRLAQDPKLRITVITGAEDALESNTFYAQGGIIGRGPNDSADLLIEDIERAGAGLSNPAAVRIVAHEGPPLLQELLVHKLCVPFATIQGNGLEYIKEAAHSTERILHVGDFTGKAIQEKLVAALCATSNIQVLARQTAVDLLTPAHHALNRRSVYDPLSCVGAYVFDQSTGKVNAYLARKTILATGGLGRIFLHSTNPPRARGDGLAMAYNAGARIINAEYVQFHPTAFYYRNEVHFLVTEAVRGAGGRLVDGHGKPFMQKYDPEWKDLAPRDVVARSIHREMLATGSKSVFLDLRSYVPADKIKTHFPDICRRALELGVDITRDLIPVVPAAHYFCGGVWVDPNGHTSVNNLFAVGEVSCTGLHGANRLGSTSLLEGLVWGTRVAGEIERTLQEPGVDAAEIPFWQDEGLTEAPDPALIRSGLLAGYAVSKGMWLLDNRIAYTSSGRLIDDPFFTGYRILDSLPFNLSQLRERLKSLHAGTVTVKKRGFPLEPEEILRKLALTGDRPVTIVLTRIGKRHHVYIVENYRTCDARNDKR